MAVKSSSSDHQYPTQALFLAGNATGITIAAVLLSYVEVAKYFGYNNFLFNKAS